jgi:hypothetical protein
MLTDITPVSEMLRFQDQDFGPKIEEYDSRTNVWTVWFRKDGQPPRGNLGTDRKFTSEYGAAR